MVTEGGMMISETCNVSPQPAGGLLEPVPDGVSAHGMRLFVTSQRESPLKHRPQISLLLELRSELLGVTPPPPLRWRCLRWTSCCRNWRR